MKCRAVEKRLYLFRDHELGPGERAQVEEHLQTCLACRQVWLQLQTLDNALQPLRSTHLPVHVNQAVLSGIRDNEHPGAWERAVAFLAQNRVRTALAFALVILISALAWERYDTQVQQQQLRQQFTAAAENNNKARWAGCREKLQRWYAGLPQNREPFRPLWSYPSSVRLDSKQRQELAHMLQECGLSAQHIRDIFNEYRI